MPHPLWPACELAGREGVAVSREGVAVLRLVSEFGQLCRSAQRPDPNHLYPGCAPIRHLRSLRSNGPLLVENNAHPCDQPANRL